jgi:hypothetical protein
MILYDSSKESGNYYDRDDVNRGGNGIRDPPFSHIK